MRTSDNNSTIVVPSFIIAIGIAAGFAYAAYWAYQIRSALASPLYRNRALCVGAAGTFFALLVLSTILIGTFAPTDRFLSLVQFGLTNFGVILVFGWIDSSVRVARRSDPLRRNTLHWTKLRIFIWVILSIAILGNLAFVLATDIFELFEPNIEFDRGDNGVTNRTRTAVTAADNDNYLGSTTDTGTTTLEEALSGPYGPAAVFGIVALVVSRRRISDITLKRHLKWLVLFVLILFFATNLLGHPLLPLRYIGMLLLACDAYFLYMAARSLSQLNHLKPNVVSRNLR